MQPFVSIHDPYIVGVYMCIHKEDIHVSMARMCGKFNLVEAGTHAGNYLIAYLHMSACTLR